MRVINVEQQLCTCYKESQEFQKLMELKDSSLVVYCHRPRNENIKQAEAVESAVSTSRDVFILHNKKDVKITTSELLSQLETKTISCPRCRKTFGHAQKLMQEVKSIDRQTAMGICDLCRKKATTTAKTSKKRFCTCNEIVKKFISVKGEQKEDIKKYVKIWLSTMGDLLKDGIALNKPKQIKTRAYSDIQINRGLYSPASRHEPEIQQMFYSGTHKSDINTEMRETNLKEGHMKPAVSFFQPIEHVESTFADTPHEMKKKSTTSLEDSVTPFVETCIKNLPRTSIIDHKQEEVFEDIPSMDAKEGLKRRHDLSLRQMMRLENDSRVPFSLSKIPDIYETPKIPPWAQKEPTSKYHVESEVDIEIPTLKYGHGPRGIRDLNFVSNREIKIRSTRAAQDSYYGPKKVNKYHHDKVKQGLYDSEEGPKKVKKLEDRYITDEGLKLQRRVDSISHYAKKSDQYVAKSKSWLKKALEPEESVGFVVKPQFFFYFPELMDQEKKQLELDVSSSHLIKDTQERLRLQAESDMKRREEERQQKLEQDQKKKLARQEKKLQTEEKTRHAIEDEKYAQDKKIQQDKAKSDKIEGYTFDKDGGIFSEFEQKHKISKESHFAEKDTELSEHIIGKQLDEEKNAKKSKSEQEDEIDKVLQRAKKDTKSEHRIDEKLDEPKLGSKLKPEQGDKIDKVLLKARKETQSDHRIYDELDGAKKGTKSKPEQRDKIDKVLQGPKKDTKSEHKIDEKLDEPKLGPKLKPEQGDKIDKVLLTARKETQSEHRIDDELDGAKKDTKSKPEQRDKIDKVLQGAKKDTKSEHRIDEKLDGPKLGPKLKPEQGDKIDKVLLTAKKETQSEHRIDDELDGAKKDTKSKPEQRDKIDKVLQGAKKDTKSEHRIDEKLDGPKLGPKLKPEQGDKIDKVLLTAKKETQSEHRIDDELDGAKKGTKSKPEQRDKIDKEQGAKKDRKSKHRTGEELDEPKLGPKLKPEQGDKIDKVLLTARKETQSKHRIDDELDGAKKGTKSKPEQRDKIDKEQGAKKDRKSKHRTGEELDEPKLDPKLKPEQGDKIDKVLLTARKETQSKHRIDDELEGAKKGTKSKPEQRDKIDKEQGAKKDRKSKHRTGEELDEPKLGPKLKPEQGDKIDKVLLTARKETQSEHRIDDELDGAKKGTKSKPEQRDKIDKEQGAKKDRKSKHRTGEELDEAKKGTKLKPELHTIDEPLQKARPEKGDKISELLQQVKKNLKSKPEKGDKIDEVLEKTKEVVKTKSELKEKEDDEVRDKGKKDPKKKRGTRDKDDKIAEEGKKGHKGKPESIKKGSVELKSGIEQNDKISVPEKPKKDFKAKFEQNDKGVETGIKPKSEKEKLQEKLHREQESKENKEILKQIKSLRQEKEALKKQLTKEREEVPKEMTTKMKRDSSQEIKVSISKILKTKKTGKDESANEIEFSVKKQEEKKEKEVKQKEVKVVPLQYEIKKLQAEHLKSKVEALKKKEQLKYDAEVAKPLEEAEPKSKAVEVKLPDTKMKPVFSDEYLIFKLIRVKQAARMKLSEISAKKKSELKEKEDDEVRDKGIKDPKLGIEKKYKGVREEIPKEIATKMKRDSSENITVSISQIQKTLKERGKEESMNKIEFSVKKQEEKEVKQQEVKVAHPQHEIEFRKLQAKHLKTKEEASRKKKQLIYEAEVAKALEEAERKSKSVELKLADINMKTGFSEENLILKLIRIKQATRMKPSEIDAEIIKAHKHHHESWTSLCPLCVHSELELDVLSLDSKLNLPKEIITDIIIGEKIFKIKRHLEKTKEAEVDPKIYRKIYFVESHLPLKEIVKVMPQVAEPVQKQILSKKDAIEIEMEPGKGVLRYALSDRTFIDKGWTMLPTEKVVRKMNVYRMRPAHPEFDWFEHNKNKRLMTYDTGERLAEFDDNGRGRWYYRSGRLALDYYDAEETNAQQRFVIYSSGEPDERGRTHPITILATFDYLGNGIVFDHTGKIRLKYNQTEGVVLDRGIGPVSHWKWHTLNDPPVLQQVMIDTQMAHKDPNILKLGPGAEKATRPDNEEMLAIEFDNFIKEKSKKLSQKFKPFQIKMKALKINEHFSLKVLDQATVYLIFRDGSTNLKLNIGMILDHQEIVDTDTAEVGEVSNSLERFPARTDSLAGLQRSVAHAQRYERLQIERERRFRPPEPCASADQLTAAASPPMRLPLRTVPTGSSSTGYCSRKPTKSLYYNTRLL